MNKINVSVFYQYLLTYMVIMIIPILLTLIVFGQATQRISAETDAAYAYKLEKISDDLDLQWKQMIKTALDIKRNTKLSPHWLQKSEYNQIEGIQEMKKYKNQMLLPDEIIYINKEDNELYTSSGKYLNEFYFQHIAELPLDSKIINEIYSAELPVLRSYEVAESNGEASESTILYAYPVSAYNTSNKTGIVIFFISQKALILRINNIVGEIGGISIHDIDNYLLTSWGSEGESDIKTFDAVSRNMKLQITMVPVQDAYTQNISNFKRLVISLLFVSLIICLSIAISFALLVFRPIKKMDILLKKLSNNPAVNKTKNEISKINMAITNTIESNYFLTNEVQEYKDRLKHNVLINLIYRNISNDILLHCKDAGVVLQDPAYSAIVVSVLNANSVSKENIIKELEQNYLLPVHVYAVDLVHQNYLVAICGIIENYDETLQKATEEIDNRLLKLGCEIKLGVGKLCYDLKDISVSFLEALSAYERNENSEKRIIRFEDTMNRGNYFWYPTQEYIQLTQSIKLGAESLAIEQLKVVKISIHRQSESRMMEKLMCLDFANALLKFLNEIDQNIKQYEAISIMLHGEPDEIFELMDKLVKNTCRFISDRNQENMNQLYQAMMNSVHKQALNPLFGLEVLADEFNLSLPAASKLFKEQCGCGFKEYLIKIRIEHAKEMLVDGQNSVAEICEKTGYLNVSHFIKTFKKMTGLTPAQYKEQYKDLHPSVTEF